jgi:hypothetical protein
MTLPGSLSRPHLWLLPSVVFLGILFAAPRARAQAPAGTDDPRATARMHAGPVYFTPTVALTNLGVDTNVFNQVDNPKSDFTLTLEPHVDVWLPFVRRALLSAYVTPAYTWYQTFSSERSFNPEVGGRFETYFNRLTLFADASYLNTRQRPSFEIDVRARRREDTAEAGAEIRIFRKLFFEAAGHQTRYRFDADAFFDGTNLQQVLNRDERSASGAVRWRYSALTTFVVRGEAIRDRFELSPERDSNSTRGTVGVEFRPRALISGSAYVGYRRFKALNPALSDYTGAVAQAGLSYRLAGLTLLSFTADRDISYSYERTQPFYVRAGYGVNLRQYLGWRLDATAGATRYRYDYKGLLDLGEAAARRSVARQDVTWNWTGSIGYRFGRDKRIGLGVTYWNRNSNLKANWNYTGLRAGLLVEYGTR